MVSSQDVRPTKIEKSSTPAQNAATELEEAAKKVEELQKELTGGKTIMKMERENVTFTTPNGVRFTKDAPFQAVEEDEVDELLRQNFRKAYPEEVVEFYER